MRSGDDQAVRFRELDKGLVVGFSRTKLRGELFWLLILMVVRAGWIVKLLEQQFEPFLIAKR